MLYLQHISGQRKVRVCNTHPAIITYDLHVHGMRMQFCCTTKPYCARACAKAKLHAPANLIGIRCKCFAACFVSTEEISANNMHLYLIASFLSTVLLCVLIISTPSSWAQQNGDLRLVDGDTTNEGRVEVYYDDQWGTVCDDSWNFRDADVVCRQLGYERAQEIHYRAKFGEGSGPIWLDDLECGNQAESIVECRHGGWGEHNCRHSEDAGVNCKRIVPTKPASMPVRLSCPRHSQDGSCQVCSNKQQTYPGECTPQAAVEGIVEAHYDDEWKPVSLYGWNSKSAQIVCNELGYPLALGSPTLDELWTNWHTLYCEPSDSDTALTFGSGALGIGTPKPLCSDDEIKENNNFRQRMNGTWLKELDCTGGERRLLDCYFREFGPNSNPTLQVATVRCGFKPHHSCSSENKEVRYHELV